MNLAALRQRLRRPLGSLGPRPGRATSETELRAVTPMVYRLALVAVGDGDSAALLTADTLVQLAHRPADTSPSVDVAAARALKQELPGGWLSWPGAAGPAEWLRLGLRREQADRVLSVLGERDALERVALALHLLYDVRRDDLDTWLGTHGMAEQLVMLASYLGRGLELVPSQPEHEQCAAVAADLLDVDEPQLGRRARLHIVGCDVCRQRASGMRRSFEILRQALLVFFRTPLRHDFDALLRRREQLARAPRISWRPVAGVALAVVLVLFAQRTGSVERVAPVAPSVHLATPTAFELLDRALDRFDAQRAPGEVWHETVRFASHGRQLELERWFEFSSLARTRIVVQQAGHQAPLLDVAGNARSVVFTAHRPGDRPRSAALRDTDLAAILPLLRQLPFTGGLGDQTVDQRTLDLTLLARARTGSPRLLGNTLHNGRTAWMLTAAMDTSNLILVIDRDTSSLLQARIEDAPGSRTRLVWDVQNFEVLQRREFRSQVFEQRIDAGTVATLNPRQLASRPTVRMGVDNARALASLPLPAELPDDMLFSYIQPQGLRSNSMVAVWEGRWSTLKLRYPLAGVRERNPVPLSLDRRFDGGSYTVIEHDTPNMTAAIFAFDGAPGVRLGLYYWHAFADGSARQAFVQRTLDSLTQANPAAVDSFEQAAAQRVRPVRLTLRVEHSTVLR